VQRDEVIGWVGCTLAESDVDIPRAFLRLRSALVQSRDAIEWAKQLVTGFAIELWCFDRFVAKLEPEPE
jgi:hypothetical protein